MNKDTIQIKGFEDTIITFDVYPCGSIYIDPHSEGIIRLYYSSERSFLYQLKEKKLVGTWRCNMKKFFNELEILITCGCIAYILLRIVESL